MCAGETSAQRFIHPLPAGRDQLKLLMEAYGEAHTGYMGLLGLYGWLPSRADKNALTLCFKKT